MRTLTVDAMSLLSARRLRQVLSEFGPRIEGEPGEYRVSVALTPSRTAAVVLHVLQRHLRERGAVPIVLHVDGETYTLRPARSGSPLERAKEASRLADLLREEAAQVRRRAKLARATSSSQLNRSKLSQEEGPEPSRI